MARSKRKHSNIWRILALAKPYMGRIILCGLFVILINAAQLAKPYITAIVMDDFLVYQKPESGVYSIWGMGLVYVGIIVISSVLTYLQANIINTVGQNIIKLLRHRVFRHIQMMPLKLLDKYSAGRLLTRATNDVEAVSELFSDVLVNLFRDIFLLIGIVVVMLQMNAELALIAFTGVPAIALVTIITRNKLRKNFIWMKALIGQINGFFAENISGMRIVQIFNRQRHKRKQFDDLNDDYFKSTMTQVRVNSFLRPVMEVINSMVISLLIWYGYGQVSGNLLELGVLYAFTTYIKQFFEPINDLAEMYNTIQSGSVSADRIYELLDQENELEDLEAGQRMERFTGRIEFEHVWFAYTEEDWVLRDVSFVIEPGQRIAFVGATGSGKSTIISLITRFYEIQKGRILIDGKDIAGMNLQDLRRNVAVVLQDVFLFAGSISENVRLDDHEISDDQIRAALEQSHADTFVDELPEGIKYPVAERGATFSAGQRQLISFARAIVHNPAIFVLDEATAHIDTETELLIQRSLDDVARGRTTLIIAHRLSTIRTCDMIFVLRRGKIREYGTHDQLIEHGGLYARLHEAQAGMAG